MIQFRKILIVLAFGLFGCIQKHDDNNETAINELRTTLTKFNEAFQSADITTLQSMLTKNYTHTNGSNKAIGKSDWLAYIDQRNKDIQSGQLEVLEYKMDQIEIQVYGSSAIVTGRVFTSTKRSNQMMESQYRVTHIWLLEDGEWKRAGFHDGKIN